MEVIRVINFEVTDIMETDEFDVEANERSLKAMASNLKQIFNFDDVLVTGHKIFINEKFECGTCIHCDLNPFEFPCNECESAHGNKPTMYINAGEYYAKNREN